jgi:hypothetical protein
MTAKTCASVMEASSCKTVNAATFKVRMIGGVASHPSHVGSKLFEHHHLRRLRRCAYCAACCNVSEGGLRLEKQLSRFEAPN